MILIHIYLNTLNVKPELKNKYSRWAERDFKPSLQSLKHEVRQFNWHTPSPHDTPRWLKKYKNMKNKELLADIKKTQEHTKIDLYLGTLDERFIYPETVEKINKLGITTINYQCDDDTAFYLNEELAPLYDYNWTTQPGSFNNYKKIGARYIYTSFGANPDIYKPYPVKSVYDATFVGRNMGYRDEFIQYISLKKEYETKIWGAGWPRSLKDISRIFSKRFVLHPGSMLKHIEVMNWYLMNYSKLSSVFQGRLSYEELIKMYSKSKISLNFSGGVGKNMYDHKNAMKSNKLRDIEATMSGAFYLTECTDKIKKVFKIGKEIECFKDKKDLDSKIKYYIDNPDEAEEIRKRGQKKSLECYTWERIFEKLFNEITLK